MLLSLSLILFTHPGSVDSIRWGFTLPRPTLKLLTEAQRLRVRSRVSLGVTFELPQPPKTFPCLHRQWHPGLTRLPTSLALSLLVKT